MTLFRCTYKILGGREEGHCAEVDVGEVFSLLGLLLVLWVSLLVLLAVICVGGRGRVWGRVRRVCRVLELLLWRRWIRCC